MYVPVYQSPPPLQTMRRLVSLLCSLPRRACPRRTLPVRDVLYGARKNALHRALEGHAISRGDALAVLQIVCEAGPGGVRLSRLAAASRFPDRVLHDAVALLGLENFLDVIERSRLDDPNDPRPELWVTLTPNGPRYLADGVRVPGKRGDA